MEHVFLVHCPETVGYYIAHVCVTPQTNGLNLLLQSLSYTFKIGSNNQLSVAAAGAIAFTCGENTVAVADAYATATALAQASAEALTKVYINCTSDNGNTYACADAGGFIEASARAVAEVLLRMIAHTHLYFLITVFLL